MKNRPSTVVIFSLLGLLLASACTTGRRTEPLAPPLQLGTPKLVRGQQVYYQQCHMCHPHGGSGLGPAVVNKPLPSALMKLQVRKGLGVMPHFTEQQISDEDLDALVEYIKLVRDNKPAPGAIRG